MHQLIITVVAIALASAYSLIFVNYLPSWSKGAEQVEVQVRSALPKLERAYDVLTKNNDGTPPVVTSAADGGFASEVIPLIKFAPPAPAGFEWRYGRNEDSSSTQYGLNYFCLHPLASSYIQGVYKGMERGIAVFSKDQAVLNTTCGASSNADFSSESWGSAPPALTFYVAYVPGVSR